MIRGYVRVGERYVHYRRAGTGPAVLLLHASPVSGAMFLEQIEVFSRHFTAIAIDTPGYGLSTSLKQEQPEISDFADAVIETMDALGLATAILYGRHTGASIAVEAGRRHPSRVLLTLCDGYPVFTPGESSRYLNQYLVPLTPVWDGSHLSFWWLRYREQHVFWPWDLQQTAYRADTDLPSVEFLHRGFTQIMMAGDRYRTAYSAAFRHDSIPALEQTRVSVMLTARRGDSLYAGFASIPPLHEKRELPRDTIEAAHAEVAIMQSVTKASLAPAAAAPHWRDAVDGARFMLPAGRGALHARVFGKPDGRAPLIGIAPAPGGFGSVEAAFATIGASHPVLAIEAPAQSDSETGDPGDVETAARWSAEALAAFGCPVNAVVGWEGSAAIAVELAERTGARAFLIDPPAVPAATREEFVQRYTLDLTPHIDGRHAPAIWTLVRDERLWTPFYKRTREAALPETSDIDAALLHAKAVDLFKQPELVAPSFRQLWAYPLSEKMAASSDRIVVFSTPQDRFRSLLVDGVVRQSLEDRAQLGGAIAAILSGRSRA